VPYTRLKSFVFACCDGPEKVYVRPDPVRDAANYFKLKTTVEILSFICNDGLENFLHKNTKKWNQAGLKHKEADVDAFHFTSGEKRGYIAFMYLAKDRMWHIKSLKENTDKRTNISRQARVTFIK